MSDALRDVRARLHREIKKGIPADIGWAHDFLDLQVEKGQHIDRGRVATDLTRALARRAEASSRPETPEKPSEFDRIPFSACFPAFQDVLLERLASRTTGALSSDAVRSLCLGLLERLSGIARLALYECYDRWRAGDSSSEGSYRSFCRAYETSQGSLVFEDYPLLARELCRATSNFCDAVAEMFERFERDRPALNQAGLLVANSGRIDKIVFDLSDFHNGGRTACLIEVESRERLLYKPKPLANDVAYGNYVRVLNEAVGSPLLHAPRALDRGRHGWCELIAHAPCTTTDELREFYTSFGALLAAQFIACGTDMHLENIIAAGPRAIPLDFETIVYPSRAAPRKQPLPSLNETALEVGMLPIAVSVGENRTDVSALGAGEIRSAFPAPIFEQINTDEMKLSPRHVTVQSGAHRPDTPGVDLAPAERAHHIALGFERVYRAVLGHRRTVEQVLRGFRGNAVRFVHRPTRVYDRVLRRLCRPISLADPGCRQLDVAHLLAALGTDHEASPAGSGSQEALFKCEAADLLNGDIPIFHAPNDGLALVHQGHVVCEAFFAESGQARLKRRLKGLGTGNLALQLDLIRAAADLSAPPAASLRPRRKGGDPCALVRALADQLVADVSKLPRAESWITLGAGRSDTLRLTFGDHFLYQGDIGICVFLAAAGFHFGCGAYQEVSDRIFSQAHRQLVRLCDSAAERGGTPVLGVSGIGGYLFAADLMTHFSRDRRFAKAGAEILGRLSPEMVDASTELDVMGGPAGLLLGASEALWRRETDLLRACAQRLISGCSLDDRPGWRTIGEEAPLAGFAHGAAGMVAALDRAVALGIPAEAAGPARAAGLAVIHEAYDARHRRWADRRKALADTSNDSWCHGSAGILMAGLACDSMLADRTCEAVIERLKEAASVFGDSLCCGAAGLADVLLQRGLQRNCADHRAAGMRLAAGIAERWANEGGLRLGGELRDARSMPGLFSGSAGVAYLLFRAARPAEFPSILALQQGRTAWTNPSLN